MSRTGSLASKGAKGRLPLQGVRVVALEQSVAGPLCSRILADLGATVVKLESADGDFARRWDSHVHGNSSYFVLLSRRKQSVRLDLHDQRDAELLHQLRGRSRRTTTTVRSRSRRTRPGAC